TTLGAGVGAHAGVTLIPFNFWVTPTLTLEGGTQFRHDYRPLLSKFGIDAINAPWAPVAAQFGYEYANAHLGLEFGSPRRFIFTLRGGISYLSTKLTGASGLASQLNELTLTDPSLRLTIPTIKIAFILYFG